MDPEQFHGFFLRWIQQLTAQLDIKIIHLDGKTSRGSYDRETKLKALHSVSAWAAEYHLVLAQQRVDEKSNEITAIPELLELLDLEGTIITSLAADAASASESLRSHWGIENSLHWVLDVTFKEDHSRIRRGHGPENMNLLRRLCVNLIKQDKAKGSINLKRYRAAMNNDYALTWLGVHNSES